ncbi:MAG: tRNA guanosine(34) transglycosylase Tgt, partial [Deltaproteobacteria bacterium]
LGTTHNLYYYIRLMADIRDAIERDGFQEFKAEFYKNLNS